MMYDLIQNALGTGLLLSLSALPVLFVFSILNDIFLVMKGRR